MPGRDGTGPLGDSRNFGRRMGYCNVITPAIAIGCGLGLGLGFGRGFRGGRLDTATALPVSNVSQKEILEEQKKILEARLSLLNNQLENFNNEE